MTAVLSQRTQKFQAHLQRGGLGVLEMRRLLEAFAGHTNFEELRHQTRVGNLLGKTSGYIVKDMLSSFKRRFLQPLDLPPIGLVSKAMLSPMPDAAKNQVLFPYFVRSDPLVEKCYVDLVLSRSDSPNARLTTLDVRDHLVTLSSNHAELAKWSDYLRVRWSQAFLTLLRHFRVMGQRPSTELQRLWLLPEPFAFFWLWFWYQVNAFLEVAKNDLWSLFCIGEKDKEELLTEGQLRSWWHYQRSGDIVHFVPGYSTVEEWLDNGLA